MNERGKSDSPILPGKLPNKGCGAPQPAEGVEGKGLAMGESDPANQVPDTALERPATCAGTDTAGGNVWPSLPKAEAQCGSSACWDLFRGRRVTGVPTGIWSV